MNDNPKFTARSILGQRLKHIVVQHYVFDGDPVGPHILFLEFDQWVHITSSDGLSVIRPVQAPEQLDDVTLDTYALSFPLISLADRPIGTQFIGATLESIQELIQIGEHEQSVGLIFLFAHGQPLVVMDTYGEDRLSFFTETSHLSSDVQIRPWRS